MKKRRRPLIAKTTKRQLAPKSIGQKNCIYAKLWIIAIPQKIHSAANESLGISYSAHYLVHLDENAINGRNNLVK